MRKVEQLLEIKVFWDMEEVPKGKGFFMSTHGDGLQSRLVPLRTYAPNLSIIRGEFFHGLHPLVGSQVLFLPGGSNGRLIGEDRRSLLLVALTTALEMDDHRWTSSGLRRPRLL